MKRALIPILVVLCSVAAVAAVPDAPTTAAVPQRRINPPLLPPIAIGKPHVCLEYYPVEAKRNDIQGSTTLRFTIGADGTAHDIAVVETSGSDMLDQAAIECAKGWTYRPAMQGDKPIAVPWKVRVDWYLHDDFEGPAEDDTTPPGANWARPTPLAGTYHGCQTSMNFVGPVAKPHGPTVLVFTVAADGTVHDVAVTQASGSEPHDNAAINCVKNWRYSPATHDGVAVSMRWKVWIRWGSRVPTIPPAYQRSELPERPARSGWRPMTGDQRQQNRQAPSRIVVRPRGLQRINYLARGGRSLHSRAGQRGKSCTNPSAF